MCGIIAAVSLTKAPANKRVWTQFNYQRARGTQGFGMLDMENGNVARSTGEYELVHHLCQVKNASKAIMFHHRVPTSTINTVKANHPFHTGTHFGKTRYALIHNGHISNAAALKLEHEKLGITYSSVLDDGTFTDTEALLWDFALTMEGKQKELKAEGGNAMICLKAISNKPAALYFGRNINPLYLTLDDTELILSSNGLAPGELGINGKKEESIKPQTLYMWDFTTHELTDRYFRFPSYSSNYSTGNSGFSNSNPNYRQVPAKYIESGSKQLSKKARKRLLHQQGITRPNLFKPNDTDLQNKCMIYLCAANGVYQEAIRLMNVALEDKRKQPASDSNTRDRILLVEAMQFLRHDPEWINSKSISPEWEALWTGKEQPQT